MMNFFAAITAFCISFGAGRIANERLKLRLKAITGLKEDFSKINTSLKYERTAAVKLVKSLAVNGSLHTFWQSMLENLNKNEDLYDAFIRCKHLIPSLTDEEYGMLGNFFISFGSSNVEAELIRVSLLYNSLCESEAKLKNDFMNKTKLARTLSVLGGIAIALLIL